MQLNFAVCVLTLAVAAPAQVTLQVTAPSATFHIGERIPLTLLYSAPPGSHAMVNPGPDGRRIFDNPLVEITPATGWTDPHKPRIGGFAYSGPVQGPVDVSLKPLTRTIDLAEYARFQQPGEYTVVIRASSKNPFDPNAAESASAAVSQPLKLRIVAASPQWQAQTLAAAVAAMAAAPHPASFNDPHRDDPYSTVADLGTDAAFHEMAAHLQDPKPGDWNNRQSIYSTALSTLPPERRPAALAAMRSVLQQPDGDISYAFLTAFTNLRIDQDHPEAWKSASEAAWNEVAATLPARTPRSRAGVADLLARSGPVTPEQRSMLAPYLAEGFRDLPPDRQKTALEANWPLLRSPSMLPVVERLARMPRLQRGTPQDTDHGFTVMNTNELRVAALRRWYELDPAAARAFVLDSIGTEHPAYSALQINFLPADPLPQFESLWATALAAGNFDNNGTLLSLLARFGAGNATAQVGAYADAAMAANTHPCGYVEPDAVAYLVRFDPPHARSVLAEILQRAAAGQHCGLPFSMIAQSAHGPALEQAAIAALDAPPQQASEAARYLARYGTPASRQPIEDHLRSFLASAGDAPAPQYDGTPASMERMLQLGLGQALLSAAILPQGWTPTPAEAAALLAQCHTPRVCATFRLAPNQLTEPQLNLLSTHMGEDMYILAPFPGQTLAELKSKLQQLPAGTVIRMPAQPGNDAMAEAARQAVKDAHLTLAEAPHRH